MHKVEIRLTTEGNEPAVGFEVYTEALKDGKYVEMAPMREVASGGSPLIMFLEGDERVIVVAKANNGRLVFDKDQNANVRVEDAGEKARREEREAQIEKNKNQAKTQTQSSIAPAVAPRPGSSSANPPSPLPNVSKR